MRKLTLPVQHCALNLFLMAALFLVVACTPEKEVYFKIFQTGDTRGAIFPYDFTENSVTSASMANAYTCIQAARNSGKAKVILLDNGDNLQGQASVYYYNFIKTNGVHILADVMNFMQYDATTVGNLDIGTGHPIYDKVISEYNFPVLGANAISTETGKPYFTPYITVEHEGVKAAILGITNPHIPSLLSKSLWSGMTFEQVNESVQFWVNYIKHQERPDLLIGLFHIGYGAGIEEMENPGLYIAQNVPGFDVVFIGHDHILKGTKVINTNGDSVLILNPAGGLHYMSDVDITVRKKGNKILSKHIDGKLTDVTQFQADSSFTRRFADAFTAIKTFVSQPIGQFTKTVNSRDAYFGPSAFIDLIHRVQLEATGAEISFSAPLSFEAQIKAGPIYMSDLFKLYRYENLIYTMSLSGREIKNYLEFSYGNWINEMRSPDDHVLLLRQTTDISKIFITPFYNFDSAAGILYEVDATKPVGYKINILSMADGKTPFDLTKIYSVAINSHRGSGGGGHLEDGAHIAPINFERRIMSISEMDLRYYLMRWIEDRKKINPEPLNQWKIVPDAYVKSAIKRDYELLFKDQ